jgi:YfiR/HmsC-like
LKSSQHIESRRANGPQIARGTAIGSALLRWGVLLVLTALLCPASVLSQEQASEDQVKAAFLFDFGKFIEWPDRSFMSDGAPFSICVLGNDPFRRALGTFGGKFIAHRPVAIWRIKNADAGLHCQVLFVSASEKSHLTGIFRALRGSNVLVVGDTDGFAAAGGAIQFTLERNHVRFLINPDAIQRAGLQISSQLLALSRIVHDGQSGGKG